MSQQRPLHGLTVLLIEDHPDSREATRALLVTLGARVLVAGDGMEALAQLRPPLPDLVLCDLRMPVMDGYEFAARVRRSRAYRRLRLVALTGLDGLADLRRTLEAGFDGHLVKPATEEALIALARRVVRRRGEEPVA